MGTKSINKTDTSRKLYNPQFLLLQSSPQRSDCCVRFDGHFDQLEHLEEEKEIDSRKLFSLSVLIPLRILLAYTYRERQRQSDGLCALSQSFAHISICSVPPNRSFIYCLWRVFISQYWLCVLVRVQKNERQTQQHRAHMWN